MPRKKSQAEEWHGFKEQIEKLNKALDTKQIYSYERGERKKLIDIAHSLVVTHPDNYFGHYLLGIEYTNRFITESKTGKKGTASFKKALKYLETALKLNPNSDELCCNIAELHHETTYEKNLTKTEYQKRREKTIHWNKEALKRNVSNINAIFNLAALTPSLNGAKKYIKQLEAHDNIHHHKDFIAYAIGDWYYKSRLVNDAIKWYERAFLVRQHEKRVDCHLHAGLHLVELYLKKKDRERARQTFYKVQEGSKIILSSNDPFLKEMYKKYKEEFVGFTKTLGRSTLKDAILKFLTKEKSMTADDIILKLQEESWAAKNKKPNRTSVLRSLRLLEGTEKIERLESKKENIEKRNKLSWKKR